MMRGFDPRRSGACLRAPRRCAGFPASQPEPCPLPANKDFRIMPLKEMIWLALSTFVFIAYLIVLFQVVSDLMRDPDVGGLAKAIWIIFLLFLPLLTALVYIFVRGRGMAERQRDALHRAKADTDAYIRGVAGKSPAEQITEAKALLDKGTINAEEYARLKAKALA
jgi:hypothetical protein